MRLRLSLSGSVRPDDDAIRLARLEEELPLASIRRPHVDVEIPPAVPLRGPDLPEIALRARAAVERHAPAGRNANAAEPLDVRASDAADEDRQPVLAVHARLGLAV